LSFFLRDAEKQRGGVFKIKKIKAGMNPLREDAPEANSASLPLCVSE
jgi:hypothetical protein